MGFRASARSLLTPGWRAAIWGAGLLWSASALPANVQETGSASVDVNPREATVGDRLQAELLLVLPSAIRLDPPRIGDQLGPFQVTGGVWTGPEESDGKAVWKWTAMLAAFETGDLEVPPVEIRLPTPEGQQILRTDPVPVTIRSVLEARPGEAEPALADLKNPALIPADYRRLAQAAAVLAALLLLSALAWFLHRRYAERLAALPVPSDPFHRDPPHVWAYAELQRLLERRLAEEGRVEEFFQELSRILKRYLGGRYRVELMERTTDEVGPLLRQAGSPRGSSAEVRSLLEQCDLVKFARMAPQADSCRIAVEQAYRIVDMTKPKEERGAA